MAQSITTITVVPGEEIELPATQEELSHAAFELVGANLLITLADGREILLVGYVDAFEGAPPHFVLSDGAAMSMDDVLAQMGQTLEQIQAAAGEAGPQAGTEPANQQASFTEGESLSLLNSLIDKGPVDPTALEYVLHNPPEHILELLQTNDGTPDAVDDHPQIENEDICLLEQSEKCIGRNSFPEDLQQETFSLDSLFLEKQICYPFGFGNEPDEHFVPSKVDGNIIANDDFGPDGPGGILSVEFNGVTYTPNGSGFICIEDPDNCPPSWKLIINTNGDPADPNGTGYGDYCFFLTGPVDHTGTNGELDLVFKYTIEDSNGTTDAANLTVCIDDGGPTAYCDLNVVTESTTPEETNCVEGNVLTGQGQVFQNSYVGFGEDADGPDGGKHVVSIKFDGTEYTPADADGDNKVEIETPNGTLTFDFDDGSYKYVAKSGLDNGPSGEPLRDTFCYTIEDSDGTPSSAELKIDIKGLLEWSIDPDSTVNEGDPAIYNVSYTGAALAAGETVFVTVDAHSGSADEGTDFSEVDPTVLTFVGGGDTSQTVQVETLADTAEEPDETYTVTIDPSEGIATDGTATTTIVDDTNSLQWSIDPDSSVTEGDTATYTVSYTGGTIEAGATVFVTVGSHDGTADGGGTDYSDLSTVLTFTSADLTKTVAVQTATDTAEEPDETYTVQIDGISPGGGSEADGTATTTITDATALQWQIDPDGQVEEGETAHYSVFYENGTIAAGATVFVTVDTTSGTATEGTDFSDGHTVLTFVGGGDTSQTVQVETLTDTVEENAETYTANITAVTGGGTIADGTATTTITDATALQWQIDPDGQVEEGETAHYSVFYENGTIAAGATVFVTVDTTSGTATEGTDFSDGHTVLTFVGGGDTSQTVQVETLTDTVEENAETYTANITAVTGGGTIADGTATTTITDATALQWQIDPDGQVEEGETAHYSVFYENGTIAAGATVFVTVDTTSGTATEGTDFSDGHTVLTFVGGGDTSQTVQVETLTDTVEENAETYTANITAVTGGGTIADGTATTTITDATALQWQIDPDSSVTEGDTAHYSVFYENGTIAAGATVFVTVDTTSGTATEGTDFSDGHTVLTFVGGGDTSQTVQVETLTDTVEENAETYTANITAVTGGGTITDGTATTTITDATALQWQIDPDSSVTEGDTAHYSVFYENGTIAAGATVFVTVDTTSGTATEGTDFSDGHTVLTFVGGGDTSQTVQVETLTDTVEENAETYTANITAVTGGGTITDGTATTTITDATALQWQIDPDSSVTEGDTAHYSVFYENGTIAPGATVFVTVDTTSGTATEGTDFSDGHTVLTFVGGGDTSQTVQVETLTDTVEENAETYTANITAVTGGGTIADGTATTTITDATALQWQIDPDSSVTEGDTAHYSVFYENGTIAAGATVFVTVDTTSGTATEGTDFSDGHTVLTFVGGGDTSQTVQVETLTDTVEENAETYTANITAVTGGGTIADGTATTTITDATALQWQIDPDSSVTEGDIAHYSVFYENGTIAAGATVFVTVDTTSGTATEGTDFSDGHTVLTFVGGGDTSQTVQVETLTDTVEENAETYTANITAVTGGGTIADGTATTTITDATALQWQIDPDSSVTEGDTAHYSVFYENGTIAAGATVFVTVDTTSGTATEGTDFSDGHTVLTFVGGGDTSQTVQVETLTDTVEENAETYTANITAVTGGGTIADGTATTTITDATALQWQIDPDSSVTEGDTAHYSVFYENGTIAPGATVFVTVDTTSGTATEGTDFSDGHTVLTFVGGGATSQTVDVQTTTDTVEENAETYTANITAVTGGGTITDGTATTTITDATALQWQIDPDSSVTEGDTAHYSVFYENGSIAPGATVFVTVDTTSGTATEGTDFTDGHTILTFVGGGATSQTVDVQTTTDTVEENAETYTANITAVTGGGTITDGTATTTITDATALQWQIDPDSSVTEGDTAHYSVFYENGTIAAGATVFVTVDTTSGTATEGTDFTDGHTILTFVGGGATSQTVDVQTTTDTVEENAETYTANITAVTGDGTIADGTATTTITDATALQWQIDPDSSVTEGDTAHYSVFYENGTIAPGATVFVTVDTTSGTATEGTDFTDGHTVLTFVGGGATSQTVDVHTTNDTVLESTETYTVNITAVTGGGTIADGTATTTIIDNDDTVPDAKDNTNGGPEATTLDSNIIIVFDRSGSMDDDPGVNGFSTRLDLEKAAVTELLKLAESGGGTINVFISDFSSDASNSGWTTVDGAIAYLSALIADGSTNYDAGLFQVTDGYSPPAGADQTLLYFLSDGVPNVDDGVEDSSGITDTEITNWQDFLDTNNIIAYAIGVGDGADQDPLDPIAYDGVANPNIDLDAILVTDDFDALVATLTGSIGNVFIGNVITDAPADDFNTNGAPALDKISNVVFNSQSGFSGPAFTILGSGVLVGNLYTITGQVGGVDYWKVVVNNDTGVYTFTVLHDLPITGTPAVLEFDYTIVDTDGDPDTAHLFIDLTDVPALSGLPLVQGSNSANNLTGSVGNVDEIFGGDDGNDTINAGGGNDYAYGGDGQDTINGENGNDVLVGGLGNDSMTGGNGNDILAGTNGDDTLIGDNGNDVLNGGPGDDSLSGGAGDDTLVTGGENDADTLDGGTGFDIADFSDNDSGHNFTVTLVAGAATVNPPDNNNTDALSGIEGIIGSQGADTINGDTVGNYLDGFSGNDSLSGGAGGDTLLGGLGSDTLDLGSSDDNEQDFVLFKNTTDGADTINDFDNTGTGLQVDMVLFGGTVNTNFDDITNDDNIAFATGNTIAGDNIAVNLDTTVEALLLGGNANEGVATSALATASTVAAEFNSEFAITASVGTDALLIVSATDGTGFSVWSYTEAGTAEIQGTELTLLGTFTSNADAVTTNFDFTT